MSGDDYISKLFTDNAHKLEEMPSGDLWARIESKLDKNVAQEPEATELKILRSTGKTRKGSLFRMLPYMAAASVLIVFIATFALLTPQYKTEASSEKIAEVEDVELALEESTETLPIIASDKDLAFEKSDQRQKEKILDEAKKMAAKENKKAEAVVEKYGLDRVNLNEKSNNLIILSPEPSHEEDDKAVIALPRGIASDFNLSENATNAAPNSQIVPRSDYQNAGGRNYANPPSADPNLADEIESYATTKQSNSIAKDAEKPMSRMKSKGAKQRSESQMLDPHLNVFEWMLGQWIDEEEEGGKSYETWRWVNPTTIEAVGTKMKGNNKIFEERLSIYFDPTLKQVFLKMPLDDTRNSVIYMLTAFDTERITFEQKEDQNAPNKVIFQRDLNGYTTIIVYDAGFLKPAQQNYLEHRNRVSNVRAIRILTPVKQKN